MYLNYMKNKLYNFQKKGISWLDSVDGIGLLADEMGLGKTIQALGYTFINPEIRSVLIVCPATIKMNWQKEIKEWNNEEALILYGKKYTPIINYPFYIINYDVLAQEIKVNNKKTLNNTSWIFKLASLNIKLLILDECQNISNNKAIRTKAIHTLKKLNPSMKIIGLSGTPIKNKPAEFFSILNLLNSNIFNNRWKYLHTFCGPKYNGFGWTFNGATNLNKLQELINPLMLRRVKDEVLKDLPPKQRIIIPLETDKVALENYKKATKQFILWANDHINKGLEIQQNIDRLKQLAYLSKRNNVIKWIEDYIKSDNKLVVATYHKNTLNDLYNYFKKDSIYIDGSITGEKRNEAINNFQNNKKIKLIICQILTVPGLTLTAANATCTVEFAWTPADHYQLEDRVHRISQKADSVFAYYLIAPNTIEKDIIKMINIKQEIVGKLLDNKNNDEIFNYTNLVKKLVKNNKDTI